MERIQGQEIDSTDAQVEVYKDEIDMCLHMYAEEEEGMKDIKELRNLDQNNWNHVLNYIYEHVFKPEGTLPHNRKSTIDYEDGELLNKVCDIYTDMCYRFGKEVQLTGYCRMTGITKETMCEWTREDSSADLSHSDLSQRLRDEREESLSNKLSSNKGNPVGILGILNRQYGWNMGQPRGTTQVIVHRSPEQIEQDYSIGIEDKEKPKPDF